jgi:hypothetical protein
VLALYIAIRIHVTRRLTRLVNQRGQSTAEYALVLLGVAGIALLVAMWARGTDKIGDLLDAVFDQVTEQVG